MDTIGKRFKAERKRLNLTQKQLAEKAGILERSLSDYECDRADPSIRNWRALATAGIDISYVLLAIPTPPAHLNCIASWLNGKQKKTSRKEIISTIQMLLEQLK